MRISELSEYSGSPVPSIKYYLREGLLHRGERTSPNQARYDRNHLRRLRLIRTLTEVGGLSIADTRTLLEGVDGESSSHHDLLGRTLMTVDADGRDDSGPQQHDLDLEYVDGLTDVDELLEKAVIGMVLGDSLPATLRRLAQASISRGQREP